MAPNLLVKTEIGKSQLTAGKDAYRMERLGQFGTDSMELGHREDPSRSRQRPLSE
jgi:hypothetical protein